MGAKRIILARELSLKEITEIRKNTPDDMEIECFIHGAMCISYSGRCLLSSYMTGRDANREIVHSHVDGNIPYKKRPDQGNISLLKKMVRVELL